MNHELKKNTTDPFSITYFLNLIQKHLLLYIVITIFALALAFINNYFARPVYRVKASVVINDEENSFSNATANLLKGIGINNQGKNFANEMLTIKSTPLVFEAIKKLDFNISYFHHSQLKSVELYKNSPIIVIINKDHPQPINIPFHVRINENGTFHLSVNEENVILYSFVANNGIGTIPKLEVQGIGEFGKVLVSKFFSFKVILNENYSFEDYQSNHYTFVIRDTRGMAVNYKNRLEVTPPDLESTVADIVLKSTTPSKDIDFLNSLTQTYSQRDLNRKIYISEKTIEYIDHQLNVVEDSLRIAEEKLQRFRSSNKVVDISMQSGKVYDEMQQLEREKANLSVNQKYYDYITDYFNQNREYSDLITPAGMGIEDPLLNNMIEELITLNSEKVSFIENNQEKSPYLRKINIRIGNLRDMILENISYVKNTTTITIKDIESRIAQLNSEIKKLPKAQRELFGIERNFNLNDAIYTFLLERRAEAEIAKASYQSDLEILEPATRDPLGPIAPKKKMNYIIALMLAVIIPTSYLRIRDLLRNTFSNRHEIEKHSILPVLGRVYKNNKKVEAVVDSYPKSHMAECFRMIRTNLNYFIQDPEKSNIIVVTSLISQEGKSFVSLNLACSLADAHKRTIILGFDLRKPKLYDRMDITESIGISNYLINQANLDDIIQPTKVNNLDAIYAGDIPPNPSELITSPRLDQLFEELKAEYDFIIVDTAPIGLVSETFDLIEKADLKILILRLNHTPKNEVLALVDEMKNKNLMNTCIAINDVPLLKKTKHGYGYYEDVKKD